MRVLLAGLLLLCLSGAAFAQAEAEGEVESIGFGGAYRPNCWTAMKLRLRPKVGDTRTYKIAIVQEDLDRDRVLYTRPFTLNGNPPGGKIEEHVWVYFMPQPRDLRIQGNASEFTNRIRIFLCKEDGKQLLQIPIVPGTSLPHSLDDKVDAFFGPSKGTRLVLLVGSSTSQPFLQVYDRAVALNEDVEFYKITPGEMPGDVKGFAAVDAIVWMGSDPSELRAESLAAIGDYVRDGGKLVVTQGDNWQKFKESELGGMLPVTLEGMANEKGPASLRLLAGMPNFADPEQSKIENLSPPWRFLSARTNKQEIYDPWSDLNEREVPIVKAKAKSGAFVNLYAESDKSSPYLARWNYGVGSVVWVGNDFGDKQIISAGTDRLIGWQAIWDRTLDWRNDTLTSLQGQKFKAPQEYLSGTQNKVDLSRSVLTGMELPRRGAALVALAMVLFIGYWLVAGPGSYFFLLARRRSHYSWVAFAVCAFAATALTAAVVKLVLRGPPQLQHVTFLHIGPDREAVAQSQFGLYIPRDGNQHIELAEITPKRFSYIIPYPMHPDHIQDSAEFPAYKEYEVPMRDRNSAESPAIDVPYRSTLKKFQARWIGTSSGGIDGKVTLIDRGLSGKLTNNTGHDLRSVFMIYTREPDMPYKGSDDEMIALRDPSSGIGSWANGATLDLAEIYSNLGIVNLSGGEGKAGVRGPLNGGWMSTWGEDFRSSIGSSERYSNDDRAALLMTIFDRLRPGRLQQGSERAERYELLRRAGRQFDASSAISAGQMLIFAKAADAAPLPFPMKVEGEQVKGEGVVYYQVIVPMDRPVATTQPTNRETWIFDLGAAQAAEAAQQEIRPSQGTNRPPFNQPRRNQPPAPRNQKR